MFKSDDGDVITVQAGSGSQFAEVEIQGGVLVYGIVDTGADITIICGKLFKLIATKATPRLKDLQQPYKIPCNLMVTLLL